jgi:transcriptional regulator with XRE-family HTH domain
MSSDTRLNDFLETIGRNLRKLRNARKESIETVAAAIQISPDLLNKIEKGICPNCKMGVLFGLCDYYKVTPADLCD